MTDHPRREPEDAPEPQGGFSLPSWVDAAIAKSQDDDAEAPPTESPPAAPESLVQSGYADWAQTSDDPTLEGEAGEVGMPSYESSEFERPAAGEPFTPEAEAEHTPGGEQFHEDDAGFDAAPAAFEEDAGFERTSPAAGPDEPFPSFLGRAASLHQAAEALEASNEPPQPAPFVRHDSPLAFAEEPATQEYDEFDQQRAEIVTQALAEPSPERPERPEPIPLPVAPPRRRGPAGPWLMAALFFAAAALVLAVLMWLRPLPR